MAEPSMTVAHYVDEQGRVYLELAGLKEWIRKRIAIREQARLGLGEHPPDRVDPGPLYAGDLLAALEKVKDGV